MTIFTTYNMRDSLKVIALFILLLSGTLAMAQTVKVKKGDARIKGNNHAGYETELEAKAEDVETSLLKYLKSLGKVKSSGDLFLLTESSLKPESKIPIYCMVKKHSSSASVWMGVDEGEWGEGAGEVQASLEKVVYEFGVKFYRDVVQLEINETEQALQAVEKQQQKYLNENKTLSTRLEDNRREKAQLEKNLENNRMEYESLLLKIDKNKHNQDSVSVANEQIRKMLEAQKQKQRKIN